MLPHAILHQLLRSIFVHVSTFACSRCIQLDHERDLLGLCFQALHDVLANASREQHAEELQVCLRARC